jgi:hypothetical protein
VNSEPTEDHLDRAKSRIRAEAQAARQRAPLPPRIAHASLATSDADSDVATQVSITDLARHSGRAFVENAYRSILRRPADSPGFEHQMGVLGSGAGKIEIIGDMRYSAEGRRNGVRVPGLLPRYLFAKLGRVPVLGLLVQWLVALAALPHMLRYQRASEASLAVRFDETAMAFRAIEQRAADHHAVLETAIEAALDEQRNDAARLEHLQHVLRQQLEALQHRIDVIESRIPDPDVIELRQLVFSMNHWTAQVRKSIEAIDAAQAGRRAADDEVTARIVLDSRAADSERARRLEALATELSAHLAADASVLDLSSGADWLSGLSARGWKVDGIESNSALHRDAREKGQSVTLGNAASLLARTAEQSLDALTIASFSRMSEVMSVPDLLREAHRLLKANGCLLIGTEQTGASEHAVTMDAVRDAGFGGVRALESGDSNAVIALRT